MIITQKMQDKPKTLSLVVKHLVHFTLISA